MATQTDSRRARSDATKAALMRAAVDLIAERGMENISIREIVSAAGQKNESALQYHFKNLTGLLNAIHAVRSEEVQVRRAELIEDLLSRTSAPTLRQICTLMVRPSFELARGSVGFRRYVKAFGHELALAESSPLKLVANQGGGGASGQQVRQLLQNALPRLDEETFLRRLEAVVMLVSVSMYHQARRKNAFRGVQSDLFLHNLIDALVGLFSAPISEETKTLAARQ